MIRRSEYCFFFNDTATTEIYTLSLHDALPILLARPGVGAYRVGEFRAEEAPLMLAMLAVAVASITTAFVRSEENTSEIQSRQYFVCRLLLVKKKKITFV